MDEKTNSQVDIAEPNRLDQRNQIDKKDQIDIFMF
jgi:hypothetical protein